MDNRSTTPLNRRGLLAALITGIVAVAGLAQAQSGRDISKINGGIEIAAGEVAGNVSAVNGSIEIGAGGRAQTAETVNGDIRLDADAAVDSLESVNGGIRLAERAHVAGKLEGVNGSITLLPGARVDADLENVNGAITLDDAEIGGKLTTTNGSVLVGSGSLIEGGLLIRKPKGWSTESRAPRIVIGPDAEVRGDLVFEREVRLYVHDRARIGRVEGATPQRYSGSAAPSE